MAKKQEQALEGPFTLVGLQTENIKNIRLVHVTFKENRLVPIYGSNGHGKTSLMDSIVMALGGKREQGPKPVRAGAERAKIILTLRGPKGEITVTRKFQPSGNQELEIVGDDGYRYSQPAELLEDLMHTPLAFDPLRFMRADKEEQRRILLRAAGQDPAALEDAIARAFDARKLAAAAHKTAAAEFGALPREEVGEESIDLQEAIAGVEALTQQKAATERAGDKLKAVREEGQRVVAELGRVEAEIQRLQALATDLRAKRDTLKQDFDAAKAAWSEAKMPTDAQFSAARQRVAIAQRQAGAIERRQQRRAAQSKMDATERTLADKEEALQSARKAIKDAVSSAVAIKGLSMHESGEIVMHGIPISECSHGEQLKIATAIAIKANPGVRIMLVRDASILDDANLRMLGEIAAAKDLLMLAECVADPGIRPAIHMVEGEATEEA